MDKTAQAFAGWADLLAVSLASLGVLAGGFAIDHMLRTAQQGMICGLADGGHCWACYAAPLLGYAAIVAWGWARTAPEPVRARP